MLKKIRYLDKKDLIRNELLKCARAGEMPFYKEFGERVGIPPQGPWKPILDLISDEQTKMGCSDITFLLRKKETGLPGQIGFVQAKNPTPDQRKKAKIELQKVFNQYCPGTRIPF